jgi:uncharacterized protein YaaN involved in tellurite resistance
MSLSQQINSIDGKLALLLKEYNNIQKENKRLAKENEQLKQQKEHNLQQTQQLQQKVETLKLTSTGLNEELKKDLEKRINGYLKEIDKCLKLLNGSNG